MNTNILICARSDASLTAVRESIGKLRNVEFFARVMSNGHVDALADIRELPDILVLELGPLWEEQFRSLENYPGDERPVVVAVAPEVNPLIMREAMRVGARDIFELPLGGNELHESITRIVQEKRRLTKSRRGKLVAVTGLKGGSGATFVAAQTAGILGAADSKTLYIDFETQFSDVALTLGLSEHADLLDLLCLDDAIDGEALRGSVTRHAAGFDIACIHATPDNWGKSPLHDIGQVLDVAIGVYDIVVVDVPRKVDDCMMKVLSRCDHLLLVMQQSIPALRNAKSIISWIDEHARPDGLICSVVLNRFDSKQSLRVQDIKNALNIEGVYTVPSDYRHVSEAESLGESLAMTSPNSNTIKALKKFVYLVAGVTPPQSGFLKRILGSNKRGESRIEPVLRD